MTDADRLNINTLRFLAVDAVERAGSGHPGLPLGAAPMAYHTHNIHFGIREHAMGAIANGMALHGGVIPYTATFLVFSDYMRPPLRLAALNRAYLHRLGGAPGACCA